jgi:TolB-like protein
MPDTSSPVYCFGPYVLDVADRSLKRAGVAIALTPKVFDVLVTLVASAGRLVEKDAIFRAVWPDTVVEEGSLTKGVFTLRQALEQNDDTVYIETVPKRGYRFVAAVMNGHAVADASGGGASTAETPSNAVAVLSLTDMSEKGDQAYFCEGLTEEIINALGRVPDLRVASYTSSARVSRRGSDAREAARELGVSWVLEGSVRRAGEAVRVSVQLLRTADGFSAWSGRFDRDLRDIFAVQDEIAGMIAQTITRQVVGTPSSPLVTSTTANTKAYGLYLEGRYLWNKRPGEVVWQALERFEQAIALDPSFAPAHAALSSVYATLGAWEYGVLPPGEALTKAKAAAARALALDPHLAAVQTAVGYVTLHFDWDPQKATAEFNDALALNPTWVDAHHWNSHALCAAGRFPESLTACRHALDTDPVNPLMHAHLAWHYYMARDFTDALEQADHVIRMEPAFHWGHCFRGWALERLGKHGEAVDSLREAVRNSGGSPVMLAGLGQAFASDGNRREALKTARDLERVRKERGALFSYEIGIIHAALGELDSAGEWLRRAQRERSGWFVYSRVDPRLDELRSKGSIEGVGLD